MSSKLYKMKYKLQRKKVDDKSTKKRKTKSELKAEKEQKALEKK